MFFFILGSFASPHVGRMIQESRGGAGHVSGILTGQGYLPGSESLRSCALGGERDRERTYRNPRGAGRDENQSPDQASTERR